MTRVPSDHCLQHISQEEEIKSQFQSTGDVYSESGQIIIQTSGELRDSGYAETNGVQGNYYVCIHMNRLPASRMLFKTFHILQSVFYVKGKRNVWHTGKIHDIVCGIIYVGIKNTSCKIKKYIGRYRILIVRWQVLISILYGLYNFHVLRYNIIL